MNKDVEITFGNITLKGILNVPKDATGIVLFAHGSGSGRLSPRNQYVAKKMQDGSLATLLMDLLTEEEEEIDERTRQYRFDIDLLTERLIGTTQWLSTQKELAPLKVGYFGASTGAAAALKAAARLGNKISAVVSRGGRPDLATDELPRVVASTLLIVGSNDYGVIELNQSAFDAMETEKKMQLIEGATHLFEEPGTLEQVAQHALRWFTSHMKS